MDGDADAVALFSPDLQGFVHVHTVKILDELVRALQHPHQHRLIVVNDAGLLEAGFLIDVQAQLVLRLGGKEEPVGAVVPEILDDLLQGGLAEALALFVFVDHEAPEPVAVVLVFVLRIEGEHAEAHQPIVGVDAEGPGHAGVFGVGLLRLPQRNFVGSDEGLILPHGERQNGVPILIIHRFQFDYHQSLFSLIL